MYGVRDAIKYSGNDGLSINLDLDTFTSFEPIQGSTVTCEVSFDKRKFIIKCDQEVVGEKTIESHWKIVPFLMTCEENI